MIYIVRQNNDSRIGRGGFHHIESGPQTNFDKKLFLCAVAKNKKWDLMAKK